MLDHLVLVVSDLEGSRRFYERCLAPLGYKVLMAYPGVVGMGVPPKPDFWLGEADAAHPPTTALHLAFRASTRQQVDEFYREALAEGGTDNGPPGVREIYHPNYYAAFVRDADGHNIEAVCHEG